MRLFALVILVPFTCLASARDMRFADIGFEDSDKHIGVELTYLNGEDALKFNLASNATMKAVSIGECVYSQKSLEREVSQIESESVRDDFKWIFIRSDFSKSPINHFFPEFKALLLRADPSCEIPDLQQLKDQLDIAAS